MEPDPRIAAPLAGSLLASLDGTPAIFRLIEELHDTPSLDRAAPEAVFRRYRSELL